ncbi:dehydratase [Photobacterium proteolyticum]|jgi:acyl dehydratase|uniref:Dehydratase n=1 Tax=Photobacterium proteolyticum TaxID=1903952 RepID=A0A1Q9GHZ6_9GAMM|nr:MULTISPECIES: MaoC family dehydratase [Photobacterium]MCG7587881.1 MaoC family dehydratase [Photobacterium sp. OFAV2-7]OLQ74099.1 dehydratase [Photobacterium proteolyticum]
MNVVDFFKQKRDVLSLHPFELKDFLSPSLRDYWLELRNKANNSQIGLLIKDHKLASNDDIAAPAEPVAQPAPIVMKPEAEKLFNELNDTLGEVIHVGQWLTVDQNRINSFADVTEDHQWIHTDPERAAEESPFKTTIAHGFLTLSLLSVLTDSVDPDNQKFPTAKMTVNVGLNQVRFPYPVKAGNRVRASTKIQSVTPIKRGLEIVQELTVEIEGVRRPGCVAESVIRLHF